jgi:glycine cleavage system H protein
VVPQELRYTAEHEWVRAESDGTLRIGITDFAQEALGDVVFVSLPTVGAQVTAGQVLGEVESTKSVSEVYAPFAGEVVSRNEELEGRPDLLNTDAYGEGWIVTIRPSADAGELDLLDAAGYEALITADS